MIKSQNNNRLFVSHDSEHRQSILDFIISISQQINIYHTDRLFRMDVDDKINLKEKSPSE